MPWKRWRTKKSSPSSNAPTAFAAAYERALKRLRARDRFVAEIRADLADGFDNDTIQAVVDRLTAQRLLDDAGLVGKLLDRNHGKEALSIDGLRQKCVERGADPSALEILSGATDPSIDVLIARFEKSERGKMRAYRFLCSRGFSEDAIAGALRADDDA
ncbi:MAG: hypothetical protein ACYC96_14635 [Fimbriimonadaceae bacterium]